MKKEFTLLTLATVILIFTILFTNKTMNEKQIREIIQDELKKSYSDPSTQPHLHDGVSNLQLSQTQLQEFIKLPPKNTSVATSTNGLLYIQQQLTGNGNLQFPIVYGNQGISDTDVNAKNTFQGGSANHGTMVVEFTPNHSAYLYFYLVGKDNPNWAQTLTGSLIAGATSATLSVAWFNITGSYAVTFSNKDVRQVTFTNGSTAITWSGGLSVGGATSSITTRLPGTGAWYGIYMPLFIRN